MQKQTRDGFVQRETIVDLLTDDEVSKVSISETAVRLAEGDEFVDLGRLDLGVRRADGVEVQMGNVLPRKVVHAQTWGKIVDLLVPADKNAARPTPR